MQSSVVFIMIGSETHEREAVLWEAKTAYQMGKPVVGVRIYRDGTHKTPQPLIDNKAKIINWNIDEISEALEDA